MKPKIITCPKCESRFDVSTFEPGSKFECANCKNVIFVPAEVIETLKPVAPPRKRPEGWGKTAPSGPAALPGAKPARAPSSGRGVPKPAPAGRRAPGVPKPAPAGRRGGGVPKPAPAGRRGGGVPTPAPTGRRPTAEPRPSVPGRAKPVGPAAGRAASRQPSPMRDEGPSRRRPVRDEGPARSNMPLMVGGGALGLVLILVLIFVFVSGGDGKKGQSVNPGGSGSGTEVASPTVDPNDPAGWDPFKKRAYWTSTLRLKPIGVSKEQAVKAWRENYAWAERYGMPELAKEAVDGLLKADSQDEWANKQVGNKLFTYKFAPEIEGIPNEQYPWDRKDEILAVVEGQGASGRVWVDDAEYRKLEELQKLEAAHLEKIEKDPKYRWTKHWIQSTHLDPAYGQYKFKVNEDFPPYLVFVQDTGEASDAKEVDRIVRRNGLIHQRLFRGWKEIMEPEIRKEPGYEDWTLPALGEVDGDRYDVLKIWVFFNEKDFRDYQMRVVRSPLPPGARAYYRRDNQWVTLYEGRGGESIKFGLQDFNSGKVFHEGTHQLVHYFTKLTMDRIRKKMGEPSVGFEEVDWRSHWFTEGVPELFGGSDETEKDSKWEPLKPYHSRIWEYRRALSPQNKENGYYFTLNELVRVSGNASLAQISRQKSVNPNVQAMLGSLFYAEAWTFCHYLWFAEGGKYRQYFRRYMIAEFEGRTGFSVFKEIMKDVCPDGDFSALEPKVIEYMNALPAKRPGER